MIKDITILVLSAAAIVLAGRFLGGSAGALIKQLNVACLGGGLNSRVGDIRL